MTLKWVAKEPNLSKSRFWWISVSAIFFFIPVVAFSQREKQKTSVGSGTEAPSAREVPVKELDRELIRERLRKVYGNFNLKLAHTWQATFEGKTETWHWTGKSWKCPPAAVTKDPVQNEVGATNVVCSEWIPASFRWWNIESGWLSNSSPLGRASFDVGQVKAEKPAGAASAQAGKDASSVEAGPSGSVTESNGEAEENGQDDPSLSRAKRWADEVWNWQLPNHGEARVYISLRNQRIDRIDTKNSTEFIEWNQKNQKVPEIEKIVLERGPTRLALVRIPDPVATPGKQKAGNKHSRSN